MLPPELTGVSVRNAFLEYDGEVRDVSIWVLKVLVGADARARARTQGLCC